MKITSIEPTPSPHSMKINVSKRLSDGEAYNYKSTDPLTGVPQFVKQLFEIDGITNIYHVVDFITIARHPRVPWETILPEVRDVLGTIENNTTFDFTPTSESGEPTESYGSIQVFFQMFRGIPLQVKLSDGQEEKRVGLPDIFTEAAMEAAPSSPNIIMEREWVEQGVRYGTVEDVEKIILEELSASYDEDRLNQLVKLAFQADGEKQRRELMTEKVTLDMLDNPDWRNRYAALDRMDPMVDDLPVLDKALDDERSSVRRLATAYLGMIDDKAVLPYLYKALKDSAANVRRTAGDCLSDLGYIEAMPAMIKTLKDDNRIVRWRAAMFLYEIGDESAIPALKAAQEDPEFEVRLQINMALERIKGGHAAKGSIWQQMTEATSGRKKSDN